MTIESKKETKQKLSARISGRTNYVTEKELEELKRLGVVEGFTFEQMHPKNKPTVLEIMVQAILRGRTVGREHNLHLKECTSCRHRFGKVTAKQAQKNRKELGDFAYEQHCYMFSEEPSDIVCPKYIRDQINFPIKKKRRN